MSRISSLKHRVERLEAAQPVPTRWVPPDDLRDPVKRAEVDAWKDETGGRVFTVTLGGVEPIPGCEEIRVSLI